MRFFIAVIALVFGQLNPLARGQEDRLATDVQPSVTNAQPEDLLFFERALPRCSYRGYWGTFHLTGRTGTAAYVFRQERFVANLEFVKENARHWIYRSQGDGSAVEFWAFSRNDDPCGKRLVWRFADGRWKPYEMTEFWGTARVDRNFTVAKDNTIAALKAAVDDHEKRINQLEQPPPK
jgi:hypothetical protein